MRFIKDFISGKLKIMNVSKKQIVAQLVKMGYPSLKSFSESEEQEPENYDILLKMPIYSLTQEKIQELQEKLDKNRNDYSVLNSKSNKDLWENDINTLVSS